jgi:hypothetical protein
LVRKPGRKRPLGRHRHRYEDNNRIYLKEIGLQSVDWTHLAQVRDQWWALVNVVMNFLFPYNVGNLLTR